MVARAGVSARASGPCWVVAYDIHDRRVWRKVHQYLRQEGLALQYSVFLVRAQPQVIDRLMQQLARWANPSTDDIRAYLLPARLHHLWLGHPPLPGDIWPAGVGLGGL